MRISQKCHYCNWLWGINTQSTPRTAHPCVVVGRRASPLHGRMNECVRARARSSARHKPIYTRYWCANEQRANDDDHKFPIASTPHRRGNNEKKKKENKGIESLAYNGREVQTRQIKFIGKMQIEFVIWAKLDAFYGCACAVRRTCVLCQPRARVYRHDGDSIVVA